MVKHESLFNTALAALKPAAELSRLLDAIQKHMRSLGPAGLFNLLRVPADQAWQEQCGSWQEENSCWNGVATLGEKLKVHDFTHEVGSRRR